jgi:hypothetical protein
LGFLQNLAETADIETWFPFRGVIVEHVKVLVVYELAVNHINVIYFGELVGLKLKRLVSILTLVLVFMMLFCLLFKYEDVLLLKNDDPPIMELLTIEYLFCLKELGRLYSRTYAVPIINSQLHLGVIVYQQS